jgi:hypothetical protein
MYDLEIDHNVQVVELIINRMGLLNTLECSGVGISF